MEIDRSARPFPASKATSGVLDPLDLGVQALTHSIGDRVSKIGFQVGEPSVGAIVKCCVLV